MAGDGGYIKLFRGWRMTDGLTPSAVFSECEAWLWLLENATWKTATRWNAKGEEIRLNPGQIHVSLRSLSTAWGWHESSVRRFLVRLEKVKKAEQSKAQSGTVLTIVNWAKYQGCDTASDTASDTVATQPRHTQQEGKERKEEKNRGAFAFDGSVIRLTQADFTKWERAFPDIDLRAALQSRDDWLNGQPEADKRRWFNSTSNFLAKRQQAAKEGKREAAFSAPC